MVTRTLRAVCHPLARTRWIALYGIDTATDGRRRPRSSIGSAGGCGEQPASR